MICNHDESRRTRQMHVLFGTKTPNTRSEPSFCSFSCKHGNLLPRLRGRSAGFCNSFHVANIGRILPLRPLRIPPSYFRRPPLLRGGSEGEKAWRFGGLEAWGLQAWRFGGFSIWPVSYVLYGASRPQKWSSLQLVGLLTFWVVTICWAVACCGTACGSWL